MPAKNWGSLRPHFIAVTNHALLDVMTAGRVLRHVIRFDTDDLGCLPIDLTLNKKYDEQQLIKTRMLDNPGKSEETLWIEHEFIGEGEEEKWNTAQMMALLVSKAPTTFHRFAGRGKSSRAAPNMKGAFVQLMDNITPLADTKSTDGTTVYYKVKRPRVDDAPGTAGPP